MEASSDESGSDSSHDESVFGAAFLNGMQKPGKGKVDHDRPPGHKRHRCTDILCFLVFLAALAGLGWIINYCRQNGDMRRLYHGYDFLGQLCGMDEGDSNLTNKPVLFWCKDKSGKGLDLEHPICRESCPMSDATSHACFDDAVLGEKLSLPNAPAGSFERNTEYLFRDAQEMRHCSSNLCSI